MPKPDVGKVAIAETRERLGTADTKGLNGELRVRQCRHLLGNVRAAFQAWSAAEICVLLDCASEINVASGVGIPVISCAYAEMPVAITNAAVQYKATFIGKLLSRLQFRHERAQRRGSNL